ncbi:uncharacterized protein LOC114720315 isoform X2 [Neltuma alba]|uniref:uncharacterized protein LOC114720315 isoform X2 n=1 Tax=Neltuma alba TaxID=207710 RepID=UPI0010A31F20|nr:uncharacterized protein LOC114720315 isoform X2 [Prosopis alba]
MEEKQLDFNQPLLSVRRFSSTVASEKDNKRKTENSSARLPPLPTYRSELKSGPIRNPGTVPFVWEQTPGRPKDEKKLQTQVGGPSSIPITPNLPPGRVLKVKQKDSDKASRRTSVTQPRKGSSVSNSSSVNSINKDVSTSQSVTSDVKKCESPKKPIQEKADSVSDDGDEAYQDALDTLSRTESFFMNCSISGLSGLDEQEAHLSRSISQDQFARAFMIDRFLPAAQAVASETPQYASKKLPVAREQPRQVRKVMARERRHPVSQQRPNNLPPYAQELCREESEDEDDLYSEFGDNTGKICGLFPRFCLLNPIPGLRMQDRMLNSPVPGMHARLSAPYSETGKMNARTAYCEKKSSDSKIGFTEEKYSTGIPRKSKYGIDQHRRGCSALPLSEGTQCDTGCTSPVVEKTLYVDSVQKVKPYSGLNASEMKVQTNHQRDDFEISRKDSKLLTVADEKATSPAKGLESLDSFLLPCSDKSINEMHVEKTKLSNKLGNQGRDLSQNSSPKVGECEKIDSARDQESFHGRIQTSFISSRKYKLAGDVEAESERREATKPVDQGLSQDFRTLASPKVVGDCETDLKSQRLMKLSNQRNSDIQNSQLPLALPLPKAPSESWLNRTLPIISSRNISLRSSPVAHIHGRGQSPKWETIVKSSDLHHDGHLRFSEELLAPVPEA